MPDTTWEQLISIFDTIDEKVYVADPETYEILYANPAKKKIFGEDIVGRKCHSAFQGLEEPCGFCTNPMIFGENLGRTYVWEFKNRKTGIWLRCIDRAIRCSDNRMARFELAIDIHDRKIAEEALQASERKYRQLVENIHEVIYVINRDGIVDYVSPAIQGLTGFSPEEIEGKQFAQFIYEDDYDRIVVRFSKALSGQAKATEYRILKKSGEYVWVRTYGKPIRQGKEVLGLQGVLSDVSSLKEMENELREREKELCQKKRDLEEMNTALHVLLRTRENDKENLEEQVLRNVGVLVTPYIEKLKKMIDNEKQKFFLAAIEENLVSITSAFTRTLHFKYQGLTPTELQIASHVKEGKTSKEIAEILDLSERTIESHRKNLRRKLGLKGKKENLRTTLLAMK